MSQTENVIQIEHNLPWLPQPNVGRIVLSSQLPPRELCSTAFVLAFSGDRLLQTHLVKRGWDLVGGHIESGESPEEAARREIYEETGARSGPLHLLGYQHLQLLGSCPPEYRYPYPHSYQLFYWAQIVALDDLAANQETLGRGLFSPHEVEKLPWVRAHRELYEAALTAATNQAD